MNDRVMQSQKQLYIFLASILLTSLSVLAAESNKLKATMLKNFDALIKLQTYSATAETFKATENKSPIMNALGSLAELKHIVPNKLKGQEPGCAAISALFSA